MSRTTPDKIKITKKKMVTRLFLCLIIAVLAAGGVEFFFNYRAVKSKNEFFEIPAVQSTEKGKLVLQYEFAKPQYISKLRLCGSFQEVQKYTLEYTFLNDFDKEDLVRITDQVYPFYSEAWSPIDRTVMSLKITFPDDDKTAVTQLQAVTVPSVNVYRCIFTVLVVFLGGLILLAGKAVLLHLEYFFLVYTLGFGILMIVGAGPKYTTWDEPVHFANIHMLSYGETVEWSAAARKEYDEGILPEVNTKEELSFMKAYLDQQSQIITSSEENSNSFLNRGQFIYLPMVALYKLGTILGLSFSNAYMLGRLGNLLPFAVLGFFAIRLAKRKKLLTAAILMFPTVVFQASMYTYDGMIVVMITLSTVLLMNVAGSREQPNMPAIIGAVVLLLLASMIKPVYLPLLLLLLLVSKEKPNKKMALAIVILILVSAAILAVFLMPSVLAALDGNLMAGGDIRGGETGIIAQVLSMLRHPFETVRLFIHEMLTMDNFRNLALKGMDDYLPTNLMLLNLGNLGCIKDEWSLVLIPLLLFLFLVDPERDNLSGNKKGKRIMGVSIILCILATWGAMYLTFSPVGASSIGGVQARYFIPLMLPAGFWLWNDRIEIKIGELTYGRAALCGVLLLMGQCIWQLIITGRCI